MSSVRGKEAFFKRRHCITKPFDWRENKIEASKLEHNPRGEKQGIQDRIAARF